MNSRNRKAFINGFFSGLAAPGLLFSDFQIPEVKKAKGCFSVAKNDAMAKLGGDWRKVGGDIRFAMSKHGKGA